jgi:hypothetical protein
MNGGVVGAGPGGNDGSLADQLVNSALRYRGQAPLIDSLMSEIGMKGGDLNALTSGLNGHAVQESKPEPVPEKKA